jgi:hypothetical protein
MKKIIFTLLSALTAISAYSKEPSKREASKQLYKKTVELNDSIIQFVYDIIPGSKDINSYANWRVYATFDANNHDHYINNRVIDLYRRYLRENHFINNYKTIKINSSRVDDLEKEAKKHLAIIDNKRGALSAKKYRYYETKFSNILIYIKLLREINRGDAEIARAGS